RRGFGFARHFGKSPMRSADSRVQHAGENEKRDRILPTRQDVTASPTGRSQAAEIRSRTPGARRLNRRRRTRALLLYSDLHTTQPDSSQPDSSPSSQTSNSKPRPSLPPHPTRPRSSAG